MTIDCKEYQGWTNWHTWNANLWLTNDEDNYMRARRCWNSGRLRKYWEDFFEGTDGIETQEINFDEIYESLNE